MTWLTPSGFRKAVDMERGYGRSGFKFLLAMAMYAANDEEYRIIHTYWPDFSRSLLDFEREGAQAAQDECRHWPFAVFLAACALHADLNNQHKINAALPGLSDEVGVRYNAPGALIPGEMLLQGGKVYVLNANNKLVEVNQ